ncbi:MAG: GYF domain-containing protein, partial [Myxococcota bacterium]|nr:GYF domain-containing protein [Myxococcota bacterium]
PQARYHYAGADGSQQELEIAEIQARIAAAPQGRHMVWKAGMAGWTAATELPEFQTQAPPPLPPPLPE